MFSSSMSNCSSSSCSYQLQQVRNISKRIKYPTYKFKFLPKKRPMKSDTNLRYAMRQFLGPKNYKGEYIFNKYYQAPTNNVPKYIVPQYEKGMALRDPKTGQVLSTTKIDSRRLIPSAIQRGARTLTSEKELHYIVERATPDFYKNTDSNPLHAPFPLNPFCKTNSLIDGSLKNYIYESIVTNKADPSVVSQKLKIKVPRLEAIIKLMSIEKDWEKSNSISANLENYHSSLSKMFPLYNARNDGENLQEIPIPENTKYSRFMVLAESQPFGPLDAANVLGLAPAESTLKKLADMSQGKNTKNKQNSKGKIVIGTKYKGEKSMFKFIDSKVGHVGYRYGAGNRDSKKDRKIGFNEVGQMIYL
ncbi:hypothetical protein ACO0RG_002186 [Hanseniaspora osmophila]